MKILALILGLFLAFLAMVYFIYLAVSDPNTLPNNAILLFILIIMGIILILYGSTRD